MFLPLSHERMTVQRLPWITILIIAANLCVFQLDRFSWEDPEERRRARAEELKRKVNELHATSYHGPRTGERNAGEIALDGNYDPFEREHLADKVRFVAKEPRWSMLPFSLFIHVGFLALFWNMYVLWICGCSLEDRWGRPFFLLFYLACGMSGGLAYALVQPQSELGLVGSAGAVAGLMGAFVVCLSRTRMRFLTWDWFRPRISLAPAWIAVSFYFVGEIVDELLGGYLFGANTKPAFTAQIGGFAFGILAAGAIRLTRLEPGSAAHRAGGQISSHPGLQPAVEHIDAGRLKPALSALQAVLQREPDNLEALGLLANTYHALGRWADAARISRRQLKTLLRKREKDLAVATFWEMRQADMDTRLTAGESFVLASALQETGHQEEAEDEYKKLMASPDNDLVGVKAALALADLYLATRQTLLARQTLRRALERAGPHPGLKEQIESKLGELPAS